MNSNDKLSEDISRVIKSDLIQGSDTSQNTKYLPSKKRSNINFIVLVDDVARALEVFLFTKSADKSGAKIKW